MAFWRRSFKNDSVRTTEQPIDGDLSDLVNHSIQYVAGKAENSTEVSYQDASGAPIEEKSPLGYAVGPITIVFLNVSKMIGTGIFSTREFHENTIFCEHYD